MNEFNLNLIGLPRVIELERGVKAAIGGACPSRVFGCHMFGNDLRYGFIYKNGSNSRIAYLINDNVKFGTINRGQCVVMFTNVLSEAGNIVNVQPAEFNQPWFNADAQDLVQEQLTVLDTLADERNELIDMLKDLSIQGIQEVKKCAEEIMNR